MLLLLPLWRRWRGRQLAWPRAAPPARASAAARSLGALCPPLLQPLLAKAAGRRARVVAGAICPVPSPLAGGGAWLAAQRIDGGGAAASRLARVASGRLARARRAGMQGERHGRHRSSAAAGGSAAACGGGGGAAAALAPVGGSGTASRVARANATSGLAPQVVAPPRHARRPQLAAAAAAAALAAVAPAPAAAAAAAAAAGALRGSCGSRGGRAPAG